MLHTTRKCTVMWSSCLVLSINFILPLVGSYQNSQEKNEIGITYCCLFILFHDEKWRELVH